MAISIRNKEVEILAREIAEKLNISMTQAIIDALKEKQNSLIQDSGPEKLFYDTLKSLSDECSTLPDLDIRPADEILGYNENGSFPW